MFPKIYTGQSVQFNEPLTWAGDGLGGNLNKGWSMEGEYHTTTSMTGASTLNIKASLKSPTPL